MAVMKHYHRYFLMSLFSFFYYLGAFAQCLPAPGAVAANAHTIYYAGGSCTFYDSLCNPLLTVPPSEAIWSCAPAKARWALVNPLSGGYYEFPNYTNQTQQIDVRAYLQPMWQSDTIFNELVLLTGINSSARLMFRPSQILSIKNFDGSKTFTEGIDYTIDGNNITQLSNKISETYAAQAGSGLWNTQHSSWTNITYIPDRSDWGGNGLFGFRGDQLPNTMAKLQQQQPLVIQALGMSLTAGLNVSGFAGDPNNFTPNAPYMHSYIELFGEALRRHFGTPVTVYNSSCGGKTAAWADQYCQAMVNPNQPDLVIIDMGMNDIWGTSNSSFKTSIQNCIQKIKAGCPQAEFILLGNMLPDITGTGSPANGASKMYGFLEQLKSLESPGVICFDMTTASDTIYRRKGAIHCTANALHPNDYLARWYAQGLSALFITGDPVPNTGKTYYVNTSGSNGDGLSIATAWTTLSKVNQAVLLPGDTVLFEGGKTFTGNIELDQNDGNDPNRPVYFSSYGIGKAIIKTTVQNKCGFQATNTQGITLRNLEFQGPGPGNQAGKDGVLFYTTLPTGYLSNIYIEEVIVSNFGYCGIRFYSDYSPNVKAGFKDVVIDRCEVFQCRENGIVTIGYDDQNTTSYQHYNIQVKNTRVHHITGYASNQHKGSGIVLSQADSVLIERCEVFETGLGNTACGGPGGIWVYSANNVTIQFCESHHNSSGGAGGCDGLGFDLDGGTSNSVIQYCYSHDNDGPGFLLGNFWGARPWKNNVVRYNISINDARTNNSPVTLFTAPGTVWEELDFYHNTVYVSPSAANNSPQFSAFQMTDFGNSMNGVACFNNIFQTTGGIPLLNIPEVFTPQKPAFFGNLYWSSGAPFSLRYGVLCNSLEQFRNAGTLCEKIGSLAVGLEADPLLQAIQSPAPTLFPYPNDSLGIARLPVNSPCVNGGLNLPNIFGLWPGEQDFWGTTIPQNGGYDVGAFEYKTGPIVGVNQFEQSASSKISVIHNPSND
ncbi:MAG TPA: hypothetical protein DCF33_05690, partial [Saprospirales bacterium]|nr:hypothetical protein [Saprospirales bacterium]